jgi:hypothetical protein
VRYNPEDEMPNQWHFVIGEVESMHEGLLFLVTSFSLSE